MSKLILESISKKWASKETINDQDTKNLLDEFFLALENGKIRASYKDEASNWHLEKRVKEGILLSFRLGKNIKANFGPFTFIDKDNLWPREIPTDKNIRIVPGGSSIRRGVYLGKNVTMMPPSYINIGAFVDDDSMIDSNALVGSCAQIGKKVHISAGVQIGGVLEPVHAMPVIIEDEAFIGANSGIFEGTRVESLAVIASGVILTSSSKIFDLVKEEVIVAKEGILSVPKNAVVVSGARDLDGDFAKKYGLKICTPIIVKYRDQKSDSKLKLEDVLRDLK